MSIFFIFVFQVEGKEEDIVKRIQDKYDTISSSYSKQAFLKLLDSIVPVTCWHFGSLEFTLRLRPASFPTVILIFVFNLKK